MSYQGKSLGQAGETLAATLLEQKQYRILQRNLRTKLGEIDILALDPSGALVVVEVKTKTTQRQGAAIEMITRAKQEKLVLLCHQLQAKYQKENVRIDVVTVDNAGSIPIIKHHKGLIEFNG